MHGPGFQTQTAFSRRPREPLCGHESERQPRGGACRRIPERGEGLRIRRNLGAIEGTRTPTPLRVHGPEPCASANSATMAWILLRQLPPLRLKWDGCGDHKAAPGKNCIPILQTHRPLSNALRLAVPRLAPRQPCNSPRRLLGEAESLKPAPILPASPSS